MKIVLFLIASCLIHLVFSQCSSLNNSCTACVNNAACGFCGDTGVCWTGTKYGPTGAYVCPGRWQYKYGSQVIQTTVGFPVNPIFADVYLYPNDPTWIQINITRPNSDETPIDLTTVQDCSGSMSPYVRKFATALPKIMSEMIANYRSSNFAYNTFIDKNILNYADFSTDYIHMFASPGLDNRPGIIQLSAVKSLEYQGWGNDICEGPFDSVVYSLTCRSIMKWRNDARKFVFIATDACFHKEGQFTGSASYSTTSCQLNCKEPTYLTSKKWCVCNTARPNYASNCGGCTQSVWDSNLYSRYCYTVNLTAFGGTPASPISNFPTTCPFTPQKNPYTCEPDPTNTRVLTDADIPFVNKYWSTTHDFASTDAIKNMFLSYNTIPILGSIFLSGTDSDWKPTFQSWGFGVYTSVGGFQGTEIVSAILNSVELSAGTIKLLAKEADTFATSITPSAGYTGVQILQTVSFNVTLKTSSPAKRNLTFYSLGYPEAIVQIWNTVPCFGCDGVSNSGSILDSCGVCKGKNVCFGCDNVPFSGKVPDECGVCGGDNSCYGCDTVINSGKVLDACGVCAGDNSTCKGCDGKVCSIYDATCTIAVVDACGVCGGNNTCVGCDGKINNLTKGEVPKITDVCGICGGNNACVGCDGVAYSGVYKDFCDVCGGNNDCVGCDGKIYKSPSKPLAFDACGICGGNNSTCIGCDGKNSVPPLVYDLCGVCNGSNECFGCDGGLNSNRTVDACGICDGDGTLCLGCDGIRYNLTLGEVPPVFDLCGVCNGTNACIGCDGKRVNQTAGEIPASFDYCDICLPAGDPSRDACIGCDGVRVDLRFEQPKMRDLCAICGGNNTCIGCDDVIYSGAVYDACGLCGGDNSTCAGCDGIPNSGAVLDKCGVCAGNNSCLLVTDIKAPVEPISTVGIALIVTGAVIGVLIGILAPILYFSYQRFVNGTNWFLPQDMANKMANIKNNPLYKGKGPRVNPLAAR